MRKNNLRKQESSPEAQMTGQVQYLSSQRKRSKQRIPVTQAPPKVLTVTNLILDYVLITGNSIATS